MDHTKFSKYAGLSLPQIILLATNALCDVWRYGTEKTRPIYDPLVHLGHVRLVPLFSKLRPGKNIVGSRLPRFWGYGGVNARHRSRQACFRRC
jgi:hypothetical protein